MNTKDVVIYGASGHGKVIADMVEKNHAPVLAFVDDNNDVWGKTVFGYPVWGGQEHLIREAVKKDFDVIIAIGDNRIRQRIHLLLEQKGISFGIAIHPSAQVGRGVDIGVGTVVMANCVINADTRIGRHCIVNTGATIDHDNEIGDFVHISPGAHLGGTVRVGDCAWIGLGASVINNIGVGENVIVGAGAVVINNPLPHTVVVGNPAKILRKNQA